MKICFGALEVFLKTKPAGRLFDLHETGQIIELRPGEKPRDAATVIDFRGSYGDYLAGRTAVLAAGSRLPADRREPAALRGLLSGGGGHQRLAAIEARREVKHHPGAAAAAIHVVAVAAERRREVVALQP